METMLGVIKIVGFLPGAFHPLPRFRDHQDVVYTCVISNIYKNHCFFFGFYACSRHISSKKSIHQDDQSRFKYVPKIMKKNNLPELFSKITHLMAPFSGFQKQ